MKKISYVSLVLLIALALPLGTVIAAPAPKVDVCHFQRDSGTYILINISENAFQAHVNHGDARPGQPVPDMPGMEFAADCSVVPSNADVTGTWRGDSGLKGHLDYHFTMVLSQVGVSVTGTINYTTGQSGNITGTVDGDAFTFTRTDNGYWATCSPCLVTLNGTYFHGFGIHSIGGAAVEWEATKQ